MARSKRGVTHPTVIPLDEVAAVDVTEVESMLGPTPVARDDQAADPLAGYRPGFFLVDFTDEGLPPGDIPHTFH